MNTVIFLTLVGIVVIFLWNRFRSDSEPEFILVPIPVQPPQRGAGCLPMVVLVLLGLLVFTLMRG